MSPASEEKILELLMDVRERVVAVETKVDNIDDTRTIALKALEISEDACEDVKEIRASLVWTQRSGVGVILAAVVQIFFTPFA